MNLSPILIYSLLSVLLLSLCSLLGLVFWSLNEGKQKNLIFIMVSIGVGALLGDAFLHLLPESFHHGHNHTASIAVIIGFLAFFVLEKFLRWHHCHQLSDESDHYHHHHIGYMSLISDAIHNFLDGLLIGSAYMVSIPIGLATTLAVFLHELPQELSDYSIMLHSGFSKLKTVLFNLFSSFTAFIGLFIALMNFNNTWMQFIIPFAAGNFIYIAAADLVPELHKETSRRKSTLQFICICLGFSFIYLVEFFEHSLMLH